MCRARARARTIKEMSKFTPNHQVELRPAHNDNNVGYGLSTWNIIIFLELQVSAAIMITYYVTCVCDYMSVIMCEGVRVRACVRASVLESYGNILTQRIMNHEYSIWKIRRGG